MRGWRTSRNHDIFDTRRIISISMSRTLIINMAILIYRRILRQNDIAECGQPIIGDII